MQFYVFLLVCFLVINYDLTGKRILFICNKPTISNFSFSAKLPAAYVLKIFSLKFPYFSISFLYCRSRFIIDFYYRYIAV